MQLARVDGVIVSTTCHTSMQGVRHVICQPLDGEGAEVGEPVLAADFMGAGMHQQVIISTDGSATREKVRDEHSPLRNFIIGLVDEATT